MQAKKVLSLGLLFILGSRYATLSTMADEVLDQYSVASAHYAAERWDLAVEEYQNIVQRFPKHQRAIDAKFFLLESLTQLKRYDEAEEIAQRFFVNFPGGSKRISGEVCGSMSHLQRVSGGLQLASIFESQLTFGYMFFEMQVPLLLLFLCIQPV